MIQKRIAVILGGSALVVAGSALFLVMNPTPVVVSTAPEKAVKAAESKNEKSTMGEVVNEEQVEDVYVFPQPGNYASNPPKEAFEKEIIAIAKGPGDDLTKVETLLSRFPVLNEEGKLLAMEYAASLIPDKEYARYKPRLFALAANAELKDAVLTDVLSRDDTLRFTTLVEILRQPPSKATDEVKEILTAYLDKDYGADPNAWDQAVRKFLAENIEE
jgi:hypothetical protein